jgi:hypothetical protein
LRVFIIETTATATEVCTVVCSLLKVTADDQLTPT